MHPVNEHVPISNKEYATLTVADAQELKCHQADIKISVGRGKTKTLTNKTNMI